VDRVKDKNVSSLTPCGLPAGAGRPPLKVLTVSSQEDVDLLKGYPDPTIFEPQGDD